MSRKRYTVAFLAGHGIGPEVIAQASRVLAAASAMHGFTVDEEHVPFGADALVRFGNPFPPSSRRAVATADAVLVAGEAGEALDALEAELDLRSSLIRVRVDSSAEVSFVSPLGDDAWEWTLARAFVLARHSKAQLALVRGDERVRKVAAVAALEADGIAFERLGLGDAVRRLVGAPDQLDVVVCRPEDAVTAAEVTGCTSSTRVAAWGRIGPRAPGVFGPTHGPAVDIAGQGVADPRSMLLAAALMLSEGLGERADAETVSAAVARITVNRTGHSTSGLGDQVLAELPLGLRFEFGGAFG